jgi:Tfp pilus assembly protein FimT
MVERTGVFAFFPTRYNKGMLFDRRIQNGGYTATELVVVFAIIAFISGMVLISFTGLNENGALNRSAQELALGIRDAQNGALGVRRIASVTPVAVGVQLNADSSIYFLFADDGDRVYSNPPDSKIGLNKVFPRGITINSLTGFPSGVATTYSAVHITFVAPESVALLSDGGGSPVGDRLDIELITPSGNATRMVTVRTSGQVSIK